MIQVVSRFLDNRGISDASTKLCMIALWDDTNIFNFVQHSNSKVYRVGYSQTTKQVRMAGESYINNMLILRDK